MYENLRSQLVKGTLILDSDCRLEKLVSGAIFEIFLYSSLEELFFRDGVRKGEELQSSMIILKIQELLQSLFSSEATL